MQMTIHLPHHLIHHINSLPFEQQAKWIHNNMYILHNKINEGAHTTTTVMGTQQQQQQLLHVTFWGARFPIFENFSKETFYYNSYYYIISI